MAELLSLRFIFNIALFLAIFFYWIFNFIIIYHLVRFGVGVQPKIFAIIFFLGTIFLFLATIILYFSLDLTPLEEVFVNFKNFSPNI